MNCVYIYIYCKSHWIVCTQIQGSEEEKICCRCWYGSHTSGNDKGQPPRPASRAWCKGSREYWSQFANSDRLGWDLMKLSGLSEIAYHFCKHLPFANKNLELFFLAGYHRLKFYLLANAWESKGAASGILQTLIVSVLGGASKFDKIILPQIERVSNASSAPLFLELCSNHCFHHV